jgi:hypothetical protein
MKRATYILAGLLVAAASLLTACTDTSVPTPTQQPAATAPSNTVRDLEADMLCSLDGGTFSGQYGWENGERVPVCVVP